MEEPQNFERRRKLFSVIILLIIIGITATLVAHAQHFKFPQKVTKTLQTSQPGLYQVTKFDDGDTIVVNMNGKDETIRMIGVDTPETKDPRKAVQCFGHAASDYTRNLIGSNRVRLDADSQSSNRDRYNRLLRYVYLPDGRLVEAEIIKNGYGFAYVSFPFDKLDEFRAYEQQARDQGKGLWSACQPTKNQYGGYTSNNE